MLKRFGLLFGGLVVVTALTWSAPGNGNGNSGNNGNGKGNGKKQVAVPEPSALAEMAVCAAGIGLATRRLLKTAKS